MPTPLTPLLTTDNPFRSAYDAAWALLRSKVDFALIFGNVPNRRQMELNPATYFASANYPDSRAIGENPNIRLAVMELDPQTERDSCSSEATMTLELQIWTGVEQQAMILDCVWTILRAMLGWRQYVRDTVTWNGQPCIVDVDARKLEISISRHTGLKDEKEDDESKDKDLEQWVGIWGTVLHFYFQTTALQQI